MLISMFPVKFVNLLQRKCNGLYFLMVLVSIIRASMRENLPSGGANNKGPDQPAHSRSLISAFVIGLLENIIPRLVLAKFQVSSWSM